MRYIIWVLIVALVAAGCGGGGGGGTPAFTYATQWNTPSGGVDGQSQSVQLFDTDNVLRYSTVLDRPTTQRQIFGVVAGTYHIHVNLYSQVGQQGIIVGTLDDLVTVSGSKTYRTAVGNAISGVRVSPSTATIVVQQTHQFYATALTSANVPTFTGSGFSWQTTGGVATVDQNGLVTGTNEGLGTVTATETASSKTGGAALTIQPSSIVTSKWTVIVFMNAANNLWPDSVLNMNQMEKVAQNPDVRFVVEWKQSTFVDPSSTFNSTRRYLVKADTTSAIASTIIQDLGPNYDMGSAAHLLDFITWTKTNYPANRYCLIIWNHGNGWKKSAGDVLPKGVSYDDESGNHIDTWQLSSALGSGVNDILAWDASLMQQLEVDYEIRDKAQYIVGSEESPPAAGYPYETIFQQFRDNPDASTLDLAKVFVDKTLQWYGSTNKITQSVIDPTQLPGLATATGNLADQLIANVGALGTIVPQVRSTAQSYSDNSINGHYRDLYDVCLKLESLGAPAAVVTASQAVRTSISQAVLYEGHNDNSPGSHGISIDFSSSAQFAPVSSDYVKLKFAQDTTWDTWLGIAP